MIYQDDRKWSDRRKRQLTQKREQQNKEGRSKEQEVGSKVRGREKKRDKRSMIENRNL